MFRVSLKSLFFVFIVCSCCGKDFKSIGVHAWRCKEKVESRDKERNNASTTGESGDETSLPLVDTELPSSTCVSVKCSCGKICNGQRGLKMHKRSCRVIKDLSGETFEDQCINDYLSTTESEPLIDDQIKRLELSCLGLRISGKLQMNISNYCCQFIILLRQILIQPSLICIQLFTTILSKILER